MEAACQMSSTYTQSSFYGFVDCFSQAVAVDLSKFVLNRPTKLPLDVHLKSSDFVLLILFLNDLFHSSMDDLN